MNKSPELKLILTLEEVNTILSALQEVPAKVCNPLSQKLIDQAKQQLEPAQKVEAELVE